MIEVAAIFGDRLTDQAGFEERQFLDPLHEEEIAGEEVSFGGVFDAGGDRFDDGPDAGLPCGGDDQFASEEVVFAGVAGDFFFAGGVDGTFKEASVGAVGGEFLFGHAEEGHSRSPEWSVARGVK